jgi:hypothetical protein
MKSTKKLFLLTLVAVFIILEAMPTYASRLVYLDKVENGSFTAIRCSDGDMHGYFVISWNAITNEYTFFDLTSQEAASACAPTQVFE